MCPLLAFLSGPGCSVVGFGKASHTDAVFHSCMEALLIIFAACDAGVIVIPKCVWL